METIKTINNMDVEKYQDSGKSIKADIFMKENIEEISVWELFRKRGLVKPLCMWGCKLCKVRLGVSDFAMYCVSSTNVGDVMFCAKHGFLKEDQTFRRKRSKSKGMKRSMSCMNTLEEMKEAEAEDNKNN